MGEGNKMRGNLSPIEFAFWIIVLSVCFLLLVGVCSYSIGYASGQREQQMKDFNIGGILIKSLDERIKQLESALTTYKIEIPK